MPPVTGLHMLKTIPTSNTMEKIAPLATSTIVNISCAASAQDGSQVTHGEKVQPKFVPRSPDRRPIQRRKRGTRSGTIVSTDFRTLGGEKDVTSTYWYSGAETQYPPPDHGDSWETCNQIVQRMDQSRCDAWKEEVDKLLIFAGLFSAIATAFTIEAYKALQPDSATTTAQILAIIAQQQLGNSNNTFPDNGEQLSSILSGFRNFTPKPYAIRINILWFLSLSFALITAMVGILCMQWLREYQRDTHLPHLETFGLTQMRREGLEKWRVPTILSALPLLLQAALVLFFIGLLDFLWNYDHIIAVVVSVFVGVTFLFLTATTILPAFQFLFHGSYRLQVPQCPYKSPQAWAFCCLCFHLFSLLSYIMPDPKFLFDGTVTYVLSDWMQWRHRFARGKHALKFLHWHHFDKYWYDSRASLSHTDQSSEPDSDFVEGLENLAETLVPESPVFYHVLQCMRTSPVETSRLGPALKRIFGDQHIQIYSAVERLSIVQAKDAIGILSLKYLPDPTTRLSPEAIHSHWELAIRINNTVLDEEAIMEFLPSISLDIIKKVQIPDDIIYQAFKCIGRLARVDRDLKYGIDNMFGLLVSALAQMTLTSDNYDEAIVDRVCEAMFEACQHIERWTMQRKPVDSRAMFRCSSWIVSAFSSSTVNENVVARWRRLPGYAKLVSLIHMLDGLSAEETFAKRILTDDATWSSVRRKFLG
ncbi:hypothetical protein AX15_005127 [Amanita polypyramis BW_CC]|nr:hypothetical protein AX15_005127 [Amanita polypyramis BW_CC]